MGTPYANEISKNAIFGCFIETYASISQLLLPYFRLKPKHTGMAPRKLSSIAPLIQVLKKSRQTAEGKRGPSGGLH
jgi:hypothetical protein